jgi:hypothetical protein
MLGRGGGSVVDDGDGVQRRRWEMGDGMNVEVP